MTIEEVLDKNNVQGLLENNFTFMYQILLPKAVRVEFLGLVHQGVAGHFGNFTTAAHVAHRAH